MSSNVIVVSQGEVKETETNGLLQCVCIYACCIVINKKGIVTKKYILTVRSTEEKLKMMNKLISPNSSISTTASVPM